jgi:hypothetical protein
VLGCAAIPHCRGSRRALRGIDAACAHVPARTRAGIHRRHRHRPPDVLREAPSPRVARRSRACRTFPA